MWLVKCTIIVEYVQNNANKSLQVVNEGHCSTINYVNLDEVRCSYCMCILSFV
jgi:hypothetical protein